MFPHFMKSPNKGIIFVEYNQSLQSLLDYFYITPQIFY